MVGKFFSNNYTEYESNGDRNKALSIEKYFNETIINNLKKSDKWKIQLTLSISFMSSKDTDEKHIMHSKSDNRNYD